MGDGSTPPVLEESARRPNLSPKFRGLLKRELPLWVEEGYIARDGAERLAERYQIGSLGRESSRLLATFIFAIGGLLVGGGALAFVAAHWEAITPPVQVGMLFAALLGFHGAGWFLWQERAMERLGRSLIFAGCLVFGANIGLMAQIFHIRSEWYHGFLAWSVGALVMAWAVRSPLAGLLALATSFTWFTGVMEEGPLLAQLFAPACILSLVPLALLTRSRALYALAGLCAALAVTFAAGEASDSAQPALLGLVLTGFALWAAGLGETPGSRWERFAPTSRISGAVLLSAAAYLWSFLDFWDEPHFGHVQKVPYWAASLLAVALLGGYLLLRSLDALRRDGKPGFLTWGPVGAALLLLVPGTLLLGGSDRWGALGAAASNVACLALGAVALGSGLASERRSHFWLGTLFLVLLVLSRFLEYETDLLLKSVAFMACGVAVLVAGVQYERYLKRKVAARG